MQAITGVDLSDLLKGAEEIIRADKMGEARRAIIQKLRRKASIKRDILALEKKIDKAKKNYNKQVEFIQKLQEGDWSALNEEDKSE